MSEEKIMNRSFAIVGAVLIQLALGAIYAWSAFTGELNDAGWTKAQTQLVFSMGLAFFAIVMVIAGRMFDKVGPTKLAMGGGIVLGIGYLLGGLIDPLNVALLTIFVGVIGGSGIGLAYVVPIKVGMMWYPDKKGLITGLAVAGFGFGATIWIYLAAALIEATSLGTTFMILGILFLVIVVVGGVWMKLPPEGWVPDSMKEAIEDVGPIGAKETVEAAEKETVAPIIEKIQIPSNEMLKTPQYYMILVTFIFSAMSGLMTIGLAKLFPEEAMMNAGIPEAEAIAYAALGIAVFYSIANGIGRIAWGSISDKLTVKRSIFLMCSIQGVFMILFQFMAATPTLLFIGITVIGFNFGGNFALFPAMTAETFGKRYVAQNYGWVFLAYGFGGIIGPQLGGFLGDNQQFNLAFTICGILTLIAAGIAFMIKPLTKKE